MDKNENTIYHNLQNADKRVLGRKLKAENAYNKKRRNIFDLYHSISSQETRKSTVN